MRPWIPLGHPDRTRPTCKERFQSKSATVFYVTAFRIIPMIFFNRYFHRYVLQRSLRQVRYPADVRLLSRLGPQMGVPPEGHPGRNPPLFG